MRFLEFFLIILEVIFVFLGWKAPRWFVNSRKLLYPLILCAAVVQIAGEGARWQMLPAYVAAIILGATGTATGRVQDGFHLAAAGMIVVGFFLGVIYPVYTLPKPTGPYPVGTVLLDVPATMLKAAHATPPGAPLTIQVWYPAVSETGLKRAPYVVGGATTGIRAQLGRRRLVSTAALLDAKFFPDFPSATAPPSYLWLGRDTLRQHRAGARSCK